MGILSYLQVLLNPTNTDHLLIDQPTHRSPTHRPTYPTFTDPTNNIVLKRLDNRKKSSLQDTNTAGKSKTVLWSIFAELNVTL